jgi:hypothetical protein
MRIRPAATVSATPAFIGRGIRVRIRRSCWQISHNFPHRAASAAIFRFSSRLSTGCRAATCNRYQVEGIAAKLTIEGGDNLCSTVGEISRLSDVLFDVGGARVQSAGRLSP